MSNDINFLLDQKKDVAKKQGKIRTLRLVAVGILLLLGLSSVTAFLLNQNAFPSSLKEEESGLLKDVSLLHDKEAKLLLVTDRLQNISEILAQRANYSLVVNSFLKQIPQEASIERFQVGKMDFELTVSSASLISIGTTIDNLTDMAKKKEIIKDLTLESLVLDQGGGKYSAVLRANL